MLRDKVTITELELLCYLCRPRKAQDLARFLKMQPATAQIYTCRLNKKGLIDIKNPRTPRAIYKTSDKGADIISRLDDLRFA